MKLSRQFNSTAANFLSEFDDFFNRAFSRSVLPEAGSRQSNGAFGVYEADEAWHLRTDLPGFSKDDVNLRVEKGILHLSPHPEGDEYAFPARTERSFRVPDNVDITRIEARLENGVLEVILPKLPEDKPSSLHIEIK